MVLDDETFYDLVGAHPTASPPQIRQAYRRAAKHWHPDKAHPADKKLAESRFKQIAEAYEVLSDVRRRQLYDIYLQCRQQGFIEVADPEDETHQSTLQVPVRGWDEFCRMFGPGLMQSQAWHAASMPRHYHDETAVDADPPLSIFEWLLGGGVLVALWWFAAWRHNRYQMLKALPPDIWRLHAEYIGPLGLLMSPFFFGNVTFREAVHWLRSSGAFDE
mmetsp:Transcript_111326/g.197192  ORF Transcript_111326/g.197192 Transcript_111326/m.197192 type:complete len:218 (-) Transcript_111326:53-706(-)